MALRAGSWTNVVLVVVTVTVMMVQTETWESGASWGEGNAAHASAHGFRENAKRISTNVAQASDQSEALGRLCLLEEASSSGKASCSNGLARTGTDWGSAGAGHSPNAFTPHPGSSGASVRVGSNPFDAAYDSANGEVYVANEGSSNVSVISGTPGSVVATIPVGSQPDGIGFDASNHYVYVANNGSNNVSVINGSTNRVVANIPVGNGPSFGVQYDPSNGYVYVANQGSNNVSVINGATVIASIPTGSPWGIAWDSATGALFVANMGSNTVSVISGNPGSVVATINVGKVPGGVTYDSATGNVYVTNDGSNNVSVISGTTLKVIGAIRVGAYPTGDAFVAVNYLVYVSNANNNNVSEINATLGSTVGAVPVGTRPLGMVYDSGNGYLYVANFLSNNMTAIPVGGSSPPTYPVSFSESGLPSGTSWSVGFGGQRWSSTGSTITTSSEPNGTYPFTVGSVPGYTANITSGNVTVKGGPASQTITFTPQTTLTSVTASPSSSTLKVGAYTNFTAIPSCTGGPCSGVTYAWSLNNTALGNLNATTGPSVKFTASASGVENLSVVATLNGHLAKNSSIITITTTPVPTLAYVSLTPPAATVNVSGTQTFAVTVGCNGGTCPPGATYSWSLNNSLGKLNVSSGPQVLFTANSTAGLVKLTITAHLNGKTATNSSAITITKPSGPAEYTVTFSESGLPGGTSWSVTFNGTPGTSSTNSVVFSNLLNNAAGYVYTVGTVPGYTSSPSSGSVVVNGANVTKSISFTAIPPGSYSVTFSETGLSSGTFWSVTFNGATQSGTGNIVFTEPNGSYQFSVGAISGYSASPSSGTIKVSSIAVSQSITFTALPPGQYSLIFSETGLPTGANWSATVGTMIHSSTASTISFNEVNGTYHYTVGAITGYTSSPSSGNVTISGASKTVAIAFAKVSTGTTYTLTFTETGLSSGTSWSVTLNGSTRSSTTTTITFQEVNGSYAFTVGTVSGYTVNPSPGSVKVNGGPASQNVTFTSSSSKGKTNQTTGFLGLPGDDGYIVIGAVVAAVAIATAVLLMRGRGKRPAPVSPSKEEPERTDDKGNAPSDSVHFNRDNPNVPTD